MPVASLSQIEAVIARTTGEPLQSVVRRTSCTGGCIHDACIVELQDGRRYFVKTNHRVGDMFAQEAFGLAALASANCIRLPNVIAAESLGSELSCLILEAIEPGEPRTGFWKSFGSQFAALHRSTHCPRYGWASDNFIGSNPQKNEARDSWLDFYREMRLEFQLRLAKQKGLGSIELFRMGQRMVDRLENWIDDSCVQPSLLHGDLWSGNYLVDEKGRAVLIDPAVYYGAREADLAMPKLFGGFPEEFFAAYDEAWPLEKGWQDRLPIYQLYHLLNHLNLFGSGYLESCLDIVRRFGS